MEEIKTETFEESKRCRDGIKRTKIVGYILRTEDEIGKKILLNGDEDEDEYYDEVILLDGDNEFQFEGQTYEVTKSALHVDTEKSLVNPEKRMVIFWKNGERKPITYKEPGVFGSTDLKIMRTEETTMEGLKNMVTGGGVTGSRTKMMLIIGAIFVVVALGMFVLPKFVPFLQKIPIFGW